MNFRWSDGHSYAVEFSANEQSFLSRASDALRQFRMDTAERYHDGETRKDMIRFRQAELHVTVNGRWLHAGEIKETKSGTSFFDSVRTVVFPATVEDNEREINRVFEEQGLSLLTKRKKILTMVHDTFRWAGALTNMILDVDDKIRNGDDD